MSYLYPNHEIIWHDGTPIPAELRSMLLAGLQPGFEILHGEFQWNVGNSLTMTYQIAVMRARQKPRTWEIRFSYPAEEATAVRPQATSAERQRFTMMIRANIAEWLEGRPSIVESARLVKQP